MSTTHFDIAPAAELTPKGNRFWRHKDLLESDDGTEFRYEQMEDRHGNRYMREINSPWAMRLKRGPSGFFKKVM